MATGKVKQIKQKTMDEIRTILSMEIDKLRDGDTSAAAVNAISNATGKFLSSIKLELEVHRVLGGKAPDVAGLLSSGETNK